MFKTQYGSFSKEADGRLTGTILFVTGLQKDGKYSVTYAFGSSPKRFRKIISKELLESEIKRIEEKYKE